MKDDFIRLVKTQWIEVENNELKNYALVQAIMFAMIFLCISGGHSFIFEIGFVKGFLSFWWCFSYCMYGFFNFF